MIAKKKKQKTKQQIS